MTTSLGSSSKKNPWLIYRDMSFLILWAVYWIWIKTGVENKAHLSPSSFLSGELTISWHISFVKRKSISQLWCNLLFQY